MNELKHSQLKLNAARLREVASSLVKFAPSVSTKIAALASELEIRAFNVENGMTP